MRKIRLFELSIGGVLLRFYFMMAVVLFLGAFGHFTFAAILGFVIAGSFILGIRVDNPAPLRKVESKVRRIEEERKKAA